MPFASDRPGGYGSWDIWVTTRASKLDPFAEPALVSDGYAELSVTAVGLGDEIEIGGFGGSSLSDTGTNAIPPLFAAAASILLGLGLALIARLVRARARWRLT